MLILKVCQHKYKTDDIHLGSGISELLHFKFEKKKQNGKQFFCPQTWQSCPVQLLFIFLLKSVLFCKQHSDWSICVCSVPVNEMMTK